MFRFIADVSAEDTKMNPRAIKIRIVRGARVIMLARGSATRTTLLRSVQNLGVCGKMTRATKPSDKSGGTSFFCAGRVSIAVHSALWPQIRTILSTQWKRRPPPPAPLGRWSLDGHHFLRAESATRDSCGDSLCSCPVPTPDVAPRPPAILPRGAPATPDVAPSGYSAI